MMEVERFGKFPEYVTTSDQFKSKLSHLTKQEKGDRLALKNVRETIEILKKTKTDEAYEQRQIITAALHDSVYGCPNIGETRDVMNQARKSKSDLLIGTTKTLKMTKEKKHQIYPQTVLDIAERCWRNNVTRVEPSIHARPHAALKGKQSPQSKINSPLVQLFSR